jgi:hypothetical protein
MGKNLWVELGGGGNVKIQLETSRFKFVIKISFAKKLKKYF